MVFKKSVCILVLALILPTLAGCSEAPITGRKQFIMVSDASMLSASKDSYSEFLKANKLSTNVEQTAVVKRIGTDIRHAVENWAAETGNANLLQHYDWEFNLVENDQVNAWCMPGGKIVVYTGLLPVAQTEAGLATVMGHEVAHAVARHGAEQMTANMMVGTGGALLSVALNDDEKEAVDPNSLAEDASSGYSDEEIAMITYQALTQVGLLLPHSREQEREADYMGLLFMAMAGYNPEEAPELWRRMSQQGSKKESSGFLNSFEEILSTHPTSSERIMNLEDLCYDAIPYYRNAPDKREDVKLPLTPDQIADSQKNGQQT